MIHGFNTSHLGYCCALFKCLGQNMTAWLQGVQNVAARLLTKERKHDHISSILAPLHWLPVHFGNALKILLFTFKSPGLYGTVLPGWAPESLLTST